MSAVAGGGRAILEAVWLGAWLGAVVLFGAVVAPAAFGVLPTRSLAGALVGRVLPVLFAAGMVAGAATAVSAWWAPRAWAGSWRGGLGLLTLAACGIAQFVVDARIRALRGRLTVPLEALAPGDPRRAEFGMLHGLSVLALGVAAAAAAAALVLAILAARRG